VVIVLTVCAQQFVEDGLHSAHLIKGYRAACTLALQHLKELSHSIHSQDEA
jgi:chaperonin GroEL (HSP60 family)